MPLRRLDVTKFSVFISLGYVPSFLVLFEIMFSTSADESLASLLFKPVSTSEKENNIILDIHPVYPYNIICFYHSHRYVAYSPIHAFTKLLA